MSNRQATPTTARPAKPPVPALGAPPRYKLAIVSWIGIYPLITLILWVIGPATRQLPLPLVTLALTIVLVSLQTFVVMPALQRLLRGWLHARRSDDA